ncbi:MAG: poly-gamma-glutamate biosynthesis protein PgsC [Phycisphaerae bacterium]|nr:poly-gamma-glutamate biosynthesis protein PgsC [Phycisphaerae bacterium]
MDPLALAIGVGLVVSLLLSEVFGLAAGGMVVPGYIALYLTKPGDVVLTLAAGFLTFALVHAFSTVMIIYGRRRTVLMILVGYLINGAFTSFVGPYASALGGGDYSVIGYIIPGLIGIWLDRQGVLETFSALLTAAVVVRLILIVVLGTGLQP